MKLVWRHSAELQLRAQLQFIKAANPQAELRVRRRIQQRLMRLRRAPLTGRPTPAENVRELVIVRTPYVAVYLVKDGVITILQFFHMSQDRST